MRSQQDLRGILPAKGLLKIGFGMQRSEGRRIVQLKHCGGLQERIGGKLGGVDGGVEVVTAGCSGESGGKHLQQRSGKLMAVF